MCIILFKHGIRWNIDNYRHMIACCCSLADDESESSDTGGNYEDIEARLQQERIDYLQNQRKRFDSDQ